MLFFTGWTQFKASPLIFWQGKARPPSLPSAWPLLARVHTPTLRCIVVAYVSILCHDVLSADVAQIRNLVVEPDDVAPVLVLDVLALRRADAVGWVARREWVGVGRDR